jgi:hypothetical protein
VSSVDVVAIKLTIYFNMLCYILADIVLSWLIDTGITCVTIFTARVMPYSDMQNLKERLELILTNGIKVDYDYVPRAGVLDILRYEL